MTNEWADLAEPESARTNLMLVDGNNLSYRYVKRANYNSFTDDFIATVTSLGKSYKSMRTILCFDFGKSYFRSQMSDVYKSTRRKPTDPEEIKQYEEFFECLNRTSEEAPFEKYKIRGVEADDLITFFSQKYAEDYEHTWIISSDRDLYQLLDYNVSIFNLFSRKEIYLDTLVEDTGLTTEEYMLSRIIQGDTSDNVKGVAGIGDVRSQKLASEYKTLDNLLAALPIKGKAQYIQNLNASKDLLIANEKMINLRRYNQQAIECGQDGVEWWKKLNDE